MVWDAACPWVQIHTADKPDPQQSRLGLAVEPMTCAPDAFNAGSYDYDANLFVIEPAASATASWRIGAIA
jgi:aldose 1-epimerase